MENTKVNTIVLEEKETAFGFKDILGYFMGDFGCNMSFSLISGYMFIFYTQYIGIKLSHYALIILITKIFDGINDPIVGIIVDKFAPKGKDKFKPWILYGGPILSISAALMFMDLSNMSYTAKLVQCILTYVVWDICYTIVNVPYGAMASVISSKPEDRTKLSVARSFGGTFGGIFLQLVLPMLAFATIVQDGESKSIFLGEKMFPIAVGLGIIAIVSFLILQLTVKERIRRHDEELEDKEYNYLAVLKAFFKNPAMIGIVLAGVSQMVFIASAGQLHQMTYQLYFNDGRLSSYMILVNLAPLAIGSLFGNILVKKHGVKNMVSIPLIGTISVYILMLIIPIENPIVWIGLQVLAQSFSFGTVIYLWGMISDAIDYQEFLTGERNEGTIYSTYTLLRKIGAGVGQALIPFLITIINPGLVMNDNSTWLPEYALRIKNLSIIFPLIGVIIAFIGLRFVYNLTPELLAKVNKKLER